MLGRKAGMEGGTGTVEESFGCLLIALVKHPQVGEQASAAIVQGAIGELGGPIDQPPIPVGRALPIRRCGIQRPQGGPALRLGSVAQQHEQARPVAEKASSP
jgi:hypothetical protein